MPPSKVLRSGAFRLALVFAAVFAVGAFALIAAFNGAVSSYADRTTQEALQAETALLKQQGAALGQAGLVTLIKRREQTARAEHYRYLLLASGGRRLAGSLPLGVARIGSTNISLPDAPEADEAPEDDDRDGAAEVSTVRTLGFRLADGSLVVVGRDAFAMEDLTRWVNRLTLWAGVGIVLSALIGGYLIAAAFLRRLERLNAAADRIMSGRLEERLPTIGGGEEFRRLSASLNAMLDRIEALMGNLRQVSTDIAHDLRTPLTRLRSTLEGIPAGASAAEHRLAHDQALEQLDQVLATFNALLRIGLIEGGGAKARFSSVDLSEVMERVWQAYQPAAEDARKELTAKIEPDVRVTGDAELIAQLFANLIENALAHTGPKARIRLSLGKTADRVEACVADDGPGIAPEERDKVLRRFYRLDASRSTPGAGLGLALVSAVIDLHGWRLTLSDNTPGLRVSIVAPQA